MDFLLYLFNMIVSYPMLNVLIWFYLHVNNNFALAIILLTCINTLYLSWPTRYLYYRGQTIKNALTQSLNPMVRDIYRRYGEDRVALYYALAALHKENAPGTMYRLLYVKLPLFLCLVNLLYSGIGMWAALIILRGSSLQKLNEVLYPSLAHLSVLPDYSLTFLGQTTSLVKPGVLPFLLILIIVVRIVNDLILKTPPKLIRISGFPQPKLPIRLGCALLNGGAIYMVSLLGEILWANFIGAGTLLISIISVVLELLVSLFLLFLRSIGILRRGQ